MREHWRGEEGERRRGEKGRGGERRGRGEEERRGGEGRGGGEEKRREGEGRGEEGSSHIILSFLRSGAWHKPRCDLVEVAVDGVIGAV